MGNKVLDTSPRVFAIRKASGPLKGTRIVEFAGIGPGPFACMLLADMGAEVITLDRAAEAEPKSAASRGRKVIEVDLKDKAAIAEVLSTCLRYADALVEGFRPGVMERLGLGPEIVLARNKNWFTAA
jgi:alpha-methylacyl-CoA racemase